MMAMEALEKPIISEADKRGEFPPLNDEEAFDHWRTAVINPNDMGFIGQEVRVDEFDN